MLRLGLVVGFGAVGIFFIEAAEALLLQQAVSERFQAIDLLTGAILAVQLYLMKAVSDMRPKIASICTHMEHVPTKDEMNTAIDAKIEKALQQE